MEIPAPDRDVPGTLFALFATDEPGAHGYCGFIAAATAEEAIENAKASPSVADLEVERPIHLAAIVPAHDGRPPSIWIIAEELGR